MLLRTAPGTRKRQNGKGATQTIPEPDTLCKGFLALWPIQKRSELDLAAPAFPADNCGGFGQSRNDFPIIGEGPNVPVVDRDVRTGPPARRGRTARRGGRAR